MCVLFCGVVETPNIPSCWPVLLFLTFCCASSQYISLFFFFQPQNLMGRKLLRQDRPQMVSVSIPAGWDQQIHWRCRGPNQHFLCLPSTIYVSSVPRLGKNCRHLQQCPDMGVSHICFNWLWLPGLSSSGDEKEDFMRNEKFLFMTHVVHMCMDS